MRKFETPTVFLLHKFSTPSKRYAGQLKVNCTFIIRLSPLVNIGYFPESQKDSDRKKKSYKPDWDQPVHIIKGTCTSHSGDCNPSRQNRVAAMSRGG